MARYFAGVFGPTTDTYILCPDRARFDAVSGSISCLFKTTQTGSNTFMRRDSGSSRNWLLRMTGSGIVQFLVIYGANPSVDSGGAYNDGSWHNAVGTWSWNGSTTTTIELWVDGSSQGTNTASASSPSIAEPIFLGAYANNGFPSEFLDGDLAEVAMWDATLGTAEIVALSNRMSPAMIRPASLVSYTPLVRELTDIVGPVATDSGGAATTVSTHPRIIYPRRARTHEYTAAAGGSSIGLLRANAGLNYGPFSLANAGVGAIA